MSLLKQYIKFINEEKIPGGLSSGMSIEDVANKHGIDVDELKKRLEVGAKVEMEHTTDKEVAKEIAKDHLLEDPDYYEKLKTIEENSPTATLGSVNGMGSVALPGSPGSQSDYVTSETGSGDIPYNLTKGTPKKKKKKKMKPSFLTFNTYIDTLKESLNEFGPLAGSGNRDELEDKRREARTKSERKSGETFYVVGGKHGSYKVSKYYEEDNTYAAFHNGMAVPVDESVNEGYNTFKGKMKRDLTLGGKMGGKFDTPKKSDMPVVTFKKGEEVELEIQPNSYHIYGKGGKHGYMDKQMAPQLRFMDIDDYVMYESVNEERVYGLFNDAQGKPTKLDKEILDIALKALPKEIINNIEDVEGSGAFKSTAISPPTVSNKGQSRGEIEYTVITLYFSKEMGKQKIKHLSIGLRKRTSGPGTGYLYMEVDGGWDRSMPDSACAIEFIDDPAHFLRKLYDEKLAIYFK